MVQLVGVSDGLTNRQVITNETPDPFDGLGDFEYAPESFEMMQLREAERIWRDKAFAAESCLHQALHVLDRPLTKYKKADLLRLIGIAQDTLLAFEQRLFRAGRTE